MKELEAYLRTLIETFRTQPDSVRTAVGELTIDELRRPHAEGEWTPHQMLAHVVAVDEFALLPRFKRILEQDRPALEDWDAEHWMREQYEPDRPAAELLDRFEALREGFVPRLTELEMDDWNRSGVHPYHGERTLLWWLEYAVHHVREYLEQMNLDVDGD